MTFNSSSLAAAIGGAAVAAMSVAAPAQAAHQPKGSEVVHCYGINSCKGTSDCKSYGHDCKGQNDCKGQGFKEIKLSQCKAAGGKLTE